MTYRPDLQRFLNRLTGRSVLTERERQAVLNLPCHVVQTQPNADIVRLGEPVGHVSLVVAGLLGRFGQGTDGERQITMIHIPGEIADLPSVVQPLPTSALQALSAARVLHIPHASIREAAARYPALAEALWRDCVVDAAILAEWVLNVGRRSARERVAHLFCEMAIRTVGAKRGELDILFDFPITQAKLADATGLTGVHVNRMLQSLRGDGLVEWCNRGQVLIPDWDKLVVAGEFDPAYLSLGTRPEKRLRIVQAS